MRILIEESDHIDITIKSIKKNCKNIEWNVIDKGPLNLTTYTTYRDDHVFIVRGPSIKIFTKKFEYYVNQMIPLSSAIMLSKLYPGAFIKEGYEKAYKWNGIDNPDEYDHNVALVNVKQFNESITESDIQLLPYNLNAKDDSVAVKIVEPWVMLRRNAWITKYAGLLNFSEELALQNNVNAAIMFPYDILSQYVGRKKIYNPIKEKSKLLKENFGNLKMLMVKYD